MPRRFYFDTSIWIDLFENRNEPNFPKGQLVLKLLEKILKINSQVIYSELNIEELQDYGFADYEINQFFRPLENFIIFTEYTEKEARRAKDIAIRRKIPRKDALHAIIARNNNATLIAFDKHFQKVKDLTNPKRPQDFI